MREVISDTSVLQYLHLLGRLDLLPRLYGRVTVPHAVLRELERGAQLGYDVPDPSSFDWIDQASPVGNRAAALASDLGDGEREALALGLERTGALLLLDDRLAREHAVALNLEVKGTLRVLIEAKRSGLVDKVRPLFDRLDELGFRVAAKTRTAALRMASEE